MPPAAASARASATEPARPTPSATSALSHFDPAHSPGGPPTRPEAPARARPETPAQQMCALPA